jgi:homoserine dehydrogenase
MDEVQTSYYLRMRVQDKLGALAEITRILAAEQISIDALIQKESGEGEAQTDLVMLTHLTREKRINAAIRKMEALTVLAGKVNRIRLEELGK